MAKKSKSLERPRLHPVATTWWVGDVQMVKCPECGHVDDLDNFDCLGADGWVFCNACGTELE